VTEEEFALRPGRVIERDWWHRIGDLMDRTGMVREVKFSQSLRCGLETYRNDDHIIFCLDISNLDRYSVTFPGGRVVFEFLHRYPEIHARVVVGEDQLTLLALYL
jgi:hypothetical protein